MSVEVSDTPATEAMEIRDNMGSTSETVGVHAL